MTERRPISERLSNPDQGTPSGTPESIAPEGEVKIIDSATLAKIVQNYKEKKVRVQRKPTIIEGEFTKIKDSDELLDK